MIDIHMHVVPGVDDGCGDLEESLKMVRKAAKQGIDTIIATPHSFAFDDLGNEVRRRFDSLREELQENSIPVRILLGCEVYCSRADMDENMSCLAAGIYPTMNSTRYVLTEFSPRTKEKDAFYCIERLLEEGYIPLIAHAERYHFINLHTAKAIRELGGVIQINIYSVFKEREDEIRERANLMLRSQLVDFTGSDAHRLDHRPPSVKEGIKYLYQTYDTDYVNRILYENAQRLLIPQRLDEESEYEW